MTDPFSLQRTLREQAPSETAPLPDFIETATAAGLLDLAYATFESPLGKLLLAATPRGMIRLAYLNGFDEDKVVCDLAATVSPRVLAAPAKLDQPRRELEEYFEGRRHRFETPLDWRLTRGFGRRVLKATARIPYGSVSTYTQIAARAGSPRGARAAGNALGSNPLPIIVPCHRVLHSGGGLGGYTGGLDRKRLLLSVEGVIDRP